jgi:hypothetical protein
MPAPRIDTLRRQIADMTRLLHETAGILETLHELAYDRAAATEQIRVAGGQPDYALDRHGDPRARDAYTALGRMIDHLARYTAEHAGPALALVNAADNGTGRRHPATVTALEHARLIEAQAARIARGEFDPGRALPQASVPGSSKTITGKIRKLESDLAAERKRADRLEARIETLTARRAR